MIGKNFKSILTQFPQSGDALLPIGAGSQVQPRPHLVPPLQGSSPPEKPPRSGNNHLRHPVVGCHLSSSLIGVLLRCEPTGQSGLEAPANRCL